MGKFRVEVTDSAKKHFEKHYKSGDKTSINKLEKILIELEDNPYNGIGNPEQLKYNYIGFWSRRINQKDRLVYRVEEDVVTIFVVSAMGHYSDK